jgi:hypothetical protein
MTFQDTETFAYRRIDWVIREINENTLDYEQENSPRVKINFAGKNETEW